MIDQAIFFQIKIFVESIVFGLLLGMFQDIWKLLWRYIYNSSLIIDMIFGVLAGIGLFVFTITENAGILRGYLFIGWMIGWIFYRVFLQCALKRFYIVVLDSLKKIKKTVKIHIGRR